jgi:7-cyano-7-deazaguanine reductase
MHTPPSVASTPLGKKTDYVSVYTPSLLSPIPRSESRQRLGIIAEALPFQGVDVWTAYELSWLDAKGKPHVGIGRFSFPCNSPSLVESKSFKLYLNSFNQTCFGSVGEVVKTLEADLSAAAGGPVIALVLPLSTAAHNGLGHFTGENIDTVDVEVEHYQPTPELLLVDALAPVVRETLYSDLLRSNCPVTGQPDWGSVMVSYQGCPIDRAGLLKYIISFREHQDFHENCVERMFVDILECCAPEALTVAARYTRRGGLDINPYRSNRGDEPPDVRLARQ